MLVSRQFAMIFFFSLTTSCLTQQKQQPQLINVAHTKEKPLRHKLIDPTCKPENAINDLGKVQVFVYNSKDKKLHRKEEDLTGVKANPISSEFISQVLIHYHLKKSYSECIQQSKNTYLCQPIAPAKTINKGEQVSLCQKEYPKHSLENRILAALSSVNETLECLDNFNLPTKRVEINIEPYQEKEIYTNEGNYQYFESNNAYWSTASSDGKYASINFLPMTASGKQRFNQEFILNQAVGAHETGHHGFYNAAKAAFIMTKSHALNTVDDNTILPSLTTFITRALGRRKINYKLVLDAVNEGIADGIAYYCLYYNDDAHLRFGKEENFRDLDEDVPFQNKHLESQALSDFFNPNKKIYSITEPNNQDIHIIGARIMYGIDRFWGKNLHPDKKKILLIKWIKKIGQLLPIGSPKDYLGDIITEAIEEQFETNGDGRNWLNVSKCLLLKKNFPHMYSNIEEDFNCKNI